MKKLHPLLKQLLSVADKAERSLDMPTDSLPSRDLVVRVLRESARAAGRAEISLLELMVQRAAAVAAAIGALVLTLQLAASGPFAGIWNQALTQSVVLLRVFAP